jgi:hypothetical protein
MSENEPLVILAKLCLAVVVSGVAWGVLRKVALWFLIKSERHHTAER